MGLRVYLVDNDGKTDSITYGLAGENYKAILKTEILEETQQVKAWSGSKYVGIPEIDNPQATKQPKRKQHTDNYAIYDWRKHNTELEYYWVSALCTNCLESQQIAIRKHNKVSNKKIKQVECPRCKQTNVLNHAKWDGHKYVLVRGNTS